MCPSLSDEADASNVTAVPPLALFGALTSAFGGFDDSTVAIAGALVVPSSSTTVSAGCHAPAAYDHEVVESVVSRSIDPSPSRSQRYEETEPSASDEPAPLNV